MARSDTPGMQGAAATAPAAPRGARNPAVMVLAACAGNALEFFDFTVYGYFATQIQAAYFPLHDKALAATLTWITFFLAFVPRMAGAMVLGSYADRHGRKASMTLSIVLMSLGTLSLAATPGFATIGWLAPAVVIAGRLMQGFSTGGEYGGATAYMMEFARKRRGIVASFQFMSQTISMLCGALIGWAVSVAVPAHALALWGFRIPFAIGLLIAPVGWYLRSHAEESPVFQETEREASPVLAVMHAYPGRVALAAGIVAAGAGGTYLVTYLPQYAQNTLHLPAPDSFMVLLPSALVAFIMTPLAAHVSDKIGRLWPPIICCTLLLLASGPAFMLINAAPRVGVLLGAITGLTALRAAYTGPVAALLGEMFPPAVRGVGMSVGYSLGVTLFGGLAPLICDRLVALTGNRIMPGYFLAVCAAVSLASLLAVARRVRLHEV